MCTTNRYCAVPGQEAPAVTWMAVPGTCGEAGATAIVPALHAISSYATSVLHIAAAGAVADFASRSNP